MAGSTGAHDITILRTVADAQRTQRRIRLVLRSGAQADATVRVVEGYAVEITNGADGKPRVRVSVPVGTGEPIEVRLELAAIASAAIV